MRKTFLDLPIDWVSIDEAIHKISLFVDSGKPHQITTVNPEFVIESRSNKSFKKALLESDLSLPDAGGILIGQSLEDKKPGPNSLKRFVYFLSLGFQYLLAPSSLGYERVTGVQLSERIMHEAANKGWKIYLLGAKPGVAQAAAELWTQRYPGLEIVGASSSNPSDKETIPDIKEAHPDILLVAYGAPKQELFIAEHKHELNIPVMIGVGGTFDTLVGTKYNPPGWVKAIGLEWLAYLIRYPKRFKRIWNATGAFAYLVCTFQS